MSPQYGELRPTIATEIVWLVWGTPANFNGFRVLAALAHILVAFAVQFAPRIVWKLFRDVHKQT